MFLNTLVSAYLKPVTCTAFNSVDIVNIRKNVFFKVAVIC